jgi:hypothetical protein
VTPDSDQGDDQTLFAIAHSDVWWAKSQQWNATNWTVALVAGLAGLNHLMSSDDPSRFLALAQWLQVAVGILGSIYIARLHFDTIRARRRIEVIRERHPGLNDPLLTKKTVPAPDDVRGAVFPLLQIAGVSLALGLASFPVAGYAGWSLGAGLCQLVLGFAFVAIARAMAAA